jgi:hypothetical protein
MKFLRILSLMIIGSAIAAMPVDTVKIIDGKSVSCQIKSDLGKTKIGAYRLIAKAMNVLNSQSLELEVEINSLKCIEKRGGFRFIPEGPLGPYAFIIPLMEGGFTQVVANVEKAYLLAYQDGIYEELAFEDLTGASRQLVKVKLDFEAITTKLQRDQLSNGEEVFISVDMHMNKEINYSFESASDDFSDIESFGAYRFRFTLQYDLNKNLQVKLLL